MEIIVEYSKGKTNKKLKADLMYDPAILLADL